MISVKNTFHEMGFKNVEFIDIEFEDKSKLKKIDVIFLNGGYPFYLLYHLKKSGADIVLNELIDDGKVVIGLSALNAVDIRVYPHYKEHCGINPTLEEKISEFELKYNCKVNRLKNNQAILILGNRVEKIG